MLPLSWLVAAVLVGGSPAADDYIESFRRATAALEAGRLDEAEAGWRACLEERPGSATCAFHLARTEARRGRLDAALEWIALAVEWGWCDDAVLAWEPDLAALRASGDLQPVIEQARAQAPTSAPSRPAPRLQGTPQIHFPRFSPDGQRLVTARGGDAFLWDTSGGELVAVLPGGEVGIAWAAFSPDGRFLVTVHDERVSAQTVAANQVRLYFASVGHVLMHALRRLGLVGTELERAQCDTVRVRLLKIGVRVRTSVRRVVVSLSEAFPLQQLFARVLEHPRSTVRWGGQKGHAI